MLILIMNLSRFLTESLWFVEYSDLDDCCISFNICDQLNCKVICAR